MPDCHGIRGRCALTLVFGGAAAIDLLASGSARAAATPASFTGPLLDELRVVVQVSIVVRNRTIVGIKPRVLVRTPRSWLINLQALPLLRREALQAQSGSIQAVSGATVTSRAYAASLQAAIQKARTAKAL